MFLIVDPVTIQKQLIGLAPCYTGYKKLKI